MCVRRRIGAERKEPRLRSGGAREVRAKDRIAAPRPRVYDFEWREERFALAQVGARNEHPRDLAPLDRAGAHAVRQQLPVLRPRAEVDAAPARERVERGKTADEGD